MIKKFFVAVIIGLFVMSAQIAAAADVDWNSVPKIGSKSELVRYVESERRKGHNEISFTLTNGLKVEHIVDIDSEGKRHLNNFANLIVAHLSDASYVQEGTIQRLTFKITNEFPGTHVANAYLGYISWLELTYEEQKLYSVAVKIVNEANKRSSEVEKARYIHDFICDSVKKYQNNNERNKTAIGALIDGYAQCQGYSDAFYMLGRMCDLNVSRIGAVINKDNENHVLNTITFRNGRTYLVDATNNDTNNTNILFCTGRETMQQYITCDWSIIPNLQWKSL